MSIGSDWLSRKRTGAITRPEGYGRTHDHVSHKKTLIMFFSSEYALISIWKLFGTLNYNLSG